MESRQRRAEQSDCDRTEASFGRKGRAHPQRAMRAIRLNRNRAANIIISTVAMVKTRHGSQAATKAVQAKAGGDAMTEC